MEYFTVFKYHDGLYQIKDALGVLSTLVIGNEKALLFDTGYGIGNLKEEVEKIVKDQLEKYGVTLSESDINALVALMDRISKLDIDFNQLSNQLSDLSQKFEEKFGAILQDEGFWASVKNFFVNLIDTIASWFK